jgi:hypothetical protein
MTPNTPKAHLVVNADDYGYFRCVSQGILEAANRGIVTATGVIANRPGLEEQAHQLRNCQALDVGVHLNLTTGTPLTPSMRQKCARWAGVFPGKYAMSTAILMRMVRPENVEIEWRAQLERCLATGLRLSFLNSHEHIHMLPSLFGIATALSGQYGIPHVRLTTAERPTTLSPGALLRSGIMSTLQRLASRKAAAAKVRFLGLDPSGKLSADYFRRVLPSLQPGGIYELMCHPGRLDRSEVQDSRLLAYHDWEGELATLTSADVKSLLNHNGVSLIGYRDLDVADGRLTVRAQRPAHPVCYQNLP